MDVSYEDTKTDWFINIYLPRSKSRVRWSMASLAKWEVADTRADTYCGEQYLTRASPVKFVDGNVGAALLFWTPQSAREISSSTGDEVGFDLAIIDPNYVFVTLDGQGHQLNAWRRLGNTKCGLYWDATKHFFLPRPG